MRTLLTALLLFVSLLSAAQDYKFKHYDVGNGLSNNKVNSVYKDHDGFLWVGTASGLNRFDGNKFKTYFSSKDDEATLPDNYVGVIQEDGSGNLYIESGNTYVIYKRMEDRFDRNINNWLRLPNADFIPRKLFIDSDKTIWVFDGAFGLYCLKFGEENPVDITKTDKRLVEDYVSNINESENYILFVCRKGTVYAMNRKTHKIEWETKLPNVGQQTTDFSTLLDGTRFWVYSVYGVWTLDLKTHTWTDQSPVFGENRLVNTIGKDSKGNIWVGQDRIGVSVLDKYGKLTSLSGSNGFESMSVSSLYTDNNGSVWIGSFKKGLYQYNEDMYKFGLTMFPDVNCVTGNIFDANIAWLGTDAGELVKWDYINNRSESFKVSQNAIVCAMTQKQGEVWLGTYLDGLKRFYNGQVVTYHTKDGLASENVWALCGAPDDKVWVGTLGGGVQLFDPHTNSFESYTSENSGLCNNYINSMIQSRSGNLYVGTTQGVSVFDYATKTFTKMFANNNDAFAYPNVIQLAEDRHGMLWLATIEGLYVYNEATEKLYTVNIPKKNNPFILGLAEDNSGDMWVSVGAEVIKIVTRNAESKEKAPSFEFSFYNQKDGLQNSDFNQRSLFRTPTGVMLVGGLYGINSFNPQNIKFNKNAPHVLFTDIQLFHQSIKVGMKYNGHVILAEALNAGKSVDLKYSQNDFTIDFASDNFIVPENTKYYYRLVGFNSDWIECEPGIHQATYTNLSPGEYTFEVRAVNNDGVESEESASLRIVIHPPFWLTIWAMIYYFVVFVSMTIIVIRFVRQRDKVKYLKAQEEEEIRHKEELAQLELKFFTNISHDLRTPLTLILAPMDKLITNAATEKDKNRLGMVKSNAIRLLQMVNQLLDYRKVETSGLNFIAAEGDIVTFVRGICDGFTEFAENRGVKFAFTSSQEALDMTFDADKMNKIIQNLLSNAFKFTPNGGSVDVSLSAADNYMVLKVADTGIGIPDDEKGQIFSRYYQTRNTVSGGTGIGLSLVKEYAKSHNGTVEVADNPGGGTVFIVTIPIVHTAVTQETASSELEVAPEASLNTPLEGPSDKYVALVVDDDNDLLTFMYEELSADYRVLRARDGVEALEVMKEELPDIVCSDIMMPNMDGIELCKHIKSDKRMSSIPVILLSSKYNLDTKFDGLTAGADDYLTKPFNLDVLRLRMQKMIELRRNNHYDIGDESDDDGKDESRNGSGSSESVAEAEVTADEEAVGENKAAESKLLNDVNEYINANISCTELSVEDLMNNVCVGLSKGTFYKELRSITGRTPIEYIRKIRMEKAAEYFKNTDMNISEIAYKVGYNSPHFFTVQFKREFGVTPSVYIEKLGK
jgi:signal transduction histidine kinase/ligand-binding sensor domain-containing protein/DNA-binding response OmpR family regulator